MQSTVQKVMHILREEDDFLVTAHVNPDGDAIGSMSALAWMLSRMGKRVAAYNETGVPHYLDWVEFPCPFFTSLRELPFTPRRLFVLDCGSAARGGEALERFAQGMPSVCIDHHINTPGFADVNWIDPGFAAVGEMLATLALQMDISLEGPLGEAVYLAMASDTGNFSYGNTTPRTLEIAAAIVRSGLDLESFTAKHETNWSLNRVHLWGRLFNSVHLALDGQVAYMTLPDSLFEETGTALEDSEGIVNYLRRIVGVKVALTLRDAGPGKCKISLRTHGALNVQQVAAEFGGGGHRNAAGAVIAMPMDNALEAVLNVLARKLEPVAHPGLDGTQA